MSTSNSSSNEKVIFKCDRHAAIISEKLLSFYEENEFFDTVLIAGSDPVMIQGHRIVLSALSEYFLGIFRGGKISPKDHVVELSQIEAPALKLVIDFMYSGWIELSLENVENILKTATFLKMETLVDGCIHFIETHILSSNCLNWFRLAKELNLSGLKEESLNCIYTYFEKVCKEKEFLLLNEELFKDLLFNDNPHGDFEEHVFLSMVAWIKHDKINREDLTFQLLSMVRYQYLTPKFIVENRKSVCKTVESYELICSWLQWHLSPETRSVNQQISVLKPRKEVKLTAISYAESYQVNFQTYNSKEDFWFIEKETFAPKKKKACSMIVIDKKLIIVGGIVDGKPTNSVECLDLSTFKWTYLPSLQEARYHCLLENLNGNLCVYGGYYNNDDFQTSLQTYDFSTRKWNNLQPPSAPSKRSRITVTNGTTLNLVDLYNGCWQCYDASSNNWIVKRTEKSELSKFGVTAAGGYFYVIGGILKDIRVNTVWRYSFFTNTWCEMAPLSQKGSSAITAAFGNKIAVSGRDPDGTSVEEYNSDTNTWTTLSRLPIGFIPRCLYYSH